MICLIYSVGIAMPNAK